MQLLFDKAIYKGFYALCIFGLMLRERAGMFGSVSYIFFFLTFLLGIIQLVEHGVGHEGIGIAMYE